MKIRKVMFVIIGIIAIFAGLYCFTLGSGSNESNVIYGGDAYTGIQNASAQAANNVLALANIVKTGFGISFILFGLTLLIIGATIKEQSQSIAQPRNIVANSYRQPIQTSSQSTSSASAYNRNISNDASKVYSSKSQASDLNEKTSKDDGILLAKYQAAKRYFSEASNNQQYLTAMDMFLELDGYLDSEEMANKCLEMTTKET